MGNYGHQWALLMGTSGPSCCPSATIGPTVTVDYPVLIAPQYDNSQAQSDALAPD